MSGKMIAWNCGWAAVAIAAFVLGNSRSTQSDKSEWSDAAGGSAGSSGLRGDQLNDTRSKLTRDASSAADRGMIEKLFGAMSGAGLDTLAEQAFRDPNPITRRLAFGELLAAMTPENAGELREKLVAFGADGEEWRDFHYSWGAIAGREAFDFASTSEENDLSATMSGWAAANPAEALAMLDNLPPELAGDRAEIAASVVAGLADRDLASATDLVMRMEAEGVGRADRMIQSVADEALRGGGPAEAAAWASTLANGPLKGAAMDRIARDYGRTDPEAAAGWISSYASEDFAASAVAEVGERWGRSDPTAAVGWLETLPEGNGQSSGFREVLGDWEDKDPVAASQYLAAMPPSPQRDAAVSGFAQGYAWQDPQAAIAWAEDISDPNLRQQSLTRAGQAYFRRDPASAKEWLSNSGLPPEAQQQVLNPRR